MIWGKQFYNYDVERWLDGDPAQPPRRRAGGTAATRRWAHLERLRHHVDARPVGVPVVRGVGLGVPHRGAGARSTPRSRSTSCSCCAASGSSIPNGAIPAYEWAFDDLNPPVQAWAAHAGVRDRRPHATAAFLTRMFSKLLLNFTWWVNRQDADGSNLFEGGFLGLDNIGPIDRSHVPDGLRAGAIRRHRMDGLLLPATCWTWPASSPQRSLRYDDLVDQVHGALRAHLARDARQGHVGRGRRLLLRHAPHRRRAQHPAARCGRWSAIIPMFATKVIACGGPRRRRSRCARASPRWPLGAASTEEDVRSAGILVGEPGAERLVVGVANRGRARRILQHLFDEDSFLSPYGLRALSRWHAEHPFHLQMNGYTVTVDYEPAESTTGMFGGNSNWRGPIWMPLNYLVLRTLDDYSANLGDSVTVEYPIGSGQQRHAGRDRRGPAPATARPVSPRARRPAARLRLGRPPAARPELARQPAVLRVLPRRQRRRPRRHAPDRLDGADRRADRPPHDRLRAQRTPAGVP